MTRTVKPFILRESTHRHYLSEVSADGLRAVFVPSPDEAATFTAQQRAEFREKHPHITGRWVLLYAELTRPRGRL